MNINAQQVILNAYICQTIQVYIKFNLLTFRRYIATSSELYIMNKHKLFYIYMMKFQHVSLRKIKDISD